MGWGISGREQGRRPETYFLTTRTHRLSPHHLPTVHWAVDQSKDWPSHDVRGLMVQSPLNTVLLGTKPQHGAFGEGAFPIKFQGAASPSPFWGVSFYQEPEQRVKRILSLRLEASYLYMSSKVGGKPTRWPMC